jgi:hypothetical protein
METVVDCCHTCCRQQEAYRLYVPNIERENGRENVGFQLFNSLANSNAPVACKDWHGKGKVRPDRIG